MLQQVCCGNEIRNDRLMSRTAEIKVTVSLDGDNLPTRIEWQASDAQSDGPMPCQSVMLSLWDSDKKTTAAIDLWLKDTTIDDMNLHFYQAFHKMADTYLRATKNSSMAQMIHEFGDGFGDRLGLR
jgi:gliding motility-associated protein GldC